MEKYKNYRIMEKTVWETLVYIIVFSHYFVSGMNVYFM